MLVALKKSRIIFVTKFILFQFTREDRPEIVSFPLRYSFVELWKLAQASTDFYPLALYVHEGRLFGTGVRSPSSVSHNFRVIAIWSSTGPIYPRDLLPFKTVPKTSRRGSPFLSRFLHGQVLRFKVPFVKERIRAGYEGGFESKGEDHFRETHDRIILLERLHTRRAR